MTLEFARAGTYLQNVYIDFVAKRIAPRGWDYLKTAGLGVWRGQELRGAFIFHNWEPDAGVMEMSSAGEKGWLTLGAIYKAHRYIFDEAGCQLSVMRVSVENEHMCRTAEHFGYTGHVIPRLRGRDEDEVIYTLTEEDWRANRFTQRAVSRYN